jgi:hypothetical protein
MSGPSRPIWACTRKTHCKRSYLPSSDHRNHYCCRLCSVWCRCGALLQVCCCFRVGGDRVDTPWSTPARTTSVRPIMHQGSVRPYWHWPLGPVHDELFPPPFCLVVVHPGLPLHVFVLPP